MASTEEWLDDLRLRQARLREGLEEKPLTEKELLCLQMADNGFGCHACGGA